MFKKFIERIIKSENQEDAMQNVFYGTAFNEDGTVKEYGIDIAFQHDKISWKEHQMLLSLIEKMA